MSVIAHGDTKSSVKVKPGINVDLRVVPAESYGAALALRWKTVEPRKNDRGGYGGGNL